jgi:hypothetical protein
VKPPPTVAISQAESAAGYRQIVLDSHRSMTKAHDIY